MKLFKIKLSSAIIALSALFCVTAATAQNVTTPYSMYGYGILGDNATSMQKQMGGIGIGMNSGRQINVKNPASYASIDSLTFLFDLGADVSFLWSREGGKKQTTIGGGLDYLTMQFPIGKHFGASIGMLPWSSVGYAFGSEIAHGASENQGSGGINQAYAGFAGTYAGVSVGFNVSYNFGNVVNQVFLTPTGAGQSLLEHIMQVRDWNINIGAQYTARWNRWNKLVLGMTYSPKKTFLGSTWVTQQDLKNDSKPDTIAFAKMKDRYYQPNTIGAGISYSYTRDYSLLVGADFLYQDWSKCLYSPLADKEGTTVSPGMNFKNRYQAAVGAEFTPKLRGNFAQRITYRIGAHYTLDYINIETGGNTGRLHDCGIACGVGLPTLEGKTIINVGLEWKRRYTAPHDFIAEDYFNITLGINFNELWFWQRKIK